MVDAQYRITVGIPSIPQLTDKIEPLSSEDQEEDEAYEALYKDMYISCWDQLMTTGEEMEGTGWDDREYQFPE